MNNYHLFVLRLWQEPDGDAAAPPTLRIVLTRADGGEPRSFLSLAALARHLEAWALEEKLLPGGDAAPAD